MLKQVQHDKVEAISYKGNWSGERYVNLDSQQLRDRWKRGAGYFLSGVWGCPPALKVPQDWGIKGGDADFFSNLTNTTKQVILKQVQRDKVEKISYKGNWSDVCYVNLDTNNLETDEKEVQDTSCRGSGGVPQL